MDEKRIIERPQIKYHISYDEPLTLKDLEDLLHLLRTSNNDVLHEMGISREKGNDLQRIEKIEPGSIDIVAVLSVISSVVTIGEFVCKAGKLIANKIKLEREQDLRGTRRNKKVYYRNEVTVNDSELSSIYVDNSSFVINLHIHNTEDIDKITDFLRLCK